MKKIIILHNPSAGDEDHFRKELLHDLQMAGYDPNYFSIKNGKEGEVWKDAMDLSELIVIAGGDGTVRRVVGELIQWDLLRKRPPMALLPMGTANNLARSLGMDPELSHREHISNWKISSPQRFDMGVIKGTKVTDFFLEGAGVGLFPALIQQMKSLEKAKNPALSAENSVRLALEELYKLAKNWKAQDYRLETHQGVREGKFLLIEAMNIRSIGPVLELCPDAVTQDGYLDLVCIEEEHRKQLLAYIEAKLDGNPPEPKWPYMRVKSATLHTDSSQMHVDDRVIDTPHKPLILESREHILEFLVVPDLTL